jgi:hypothetical protein
MKFGSTVTSIWRVTARYMRANFRKIFGHPVEKLMRNQSQGGRLAASLLYYFQSWIQHSSDLKRTLAARGRYLACNLRVDTIFRVVQADRTDSPDGAR